ncbi:uncharacterized protein [Solanum tuberosum]|uniref:uncharacterized protein isoform X2 n=1 Tax=Solanum tuberosum TaxID=4113 RepID=UPI00073A14DF|nr:PREDICTED: uncharacterized protein LOC102604591 isoform X2 [Solanum tuberosum]
MEYNYNSWAGVPPNPALYPNPSPPVMTNSDQSVPQNPNPSSYALGYGGGHEFQGKCLVYRYGQIDGATSSVEATQVYYQDPNVVRLLGSNGPFRTASENPFVGLHEEPNKVNSANGRDSVNKAVKVIENLETKKRKVLEGGAATDDVRICLPCNVVCNSESVFRTHLIGKKHIANITKQQKSVPASASLVPLEVSVSTFIGPQEKPGIVNSGDGQDPMKKAAELSEKLETKTQKVLEGGAAANDVRQCLVCKVVCNSETVFSHHVTGKKHIANMKRQASGVTPAS